MSISGVSLACLVGQTVHIVLQPSSAHPSLIVGSIFGCKPDQFLVFTSNYPLPSGATEITAQINAVTDSNVLAITCIEAADAAAAPLVNGLLGAPLLLSQFTVQVIQVDGANVLHVQNVAHADDGDRLINDMFEAYETNNAGGGAPLAGPLRTRQLCAARSAADGNWYRCVIEALPTAADRNATVLVRYIDYGNCERLQRDQLRVLLEKYRRPGTLALRCYLALRAVSGGGTDAKAAAATVVAKIESLTAGVALELTVLDYYAGHCIVDISCLGRSLVTVLRDFKLAEPITMSTVRAQIDEDTRALLAIREEEEESVAAMQGLSLADERAEAPVAVDATPAAPVPPPVCNIYDNRIECFLSHTDRPDRFYLRRCVDEPALEQMQENIQIVAASLPPLEDASVGVMCMVKYSGDDAWYRATIIDAGPGITSVQFIDYGNTDTITDAAFIRAMNEAFRHQPPFSIACMLPLAVNAPSAGVASARSEWPDEACHLMRQLFGVRLAFEVLTHGSHCSVVSLWAPPDRDVSLELVRAGLARPVPFIPDGQRAFVSHTNSLADFYIQMEGETNSLEIVSDYLANIERFEPLSAFEPNTICTAKYAEDGHWYRARILQYSPEAGSAEVLFIDYGNTSTVQELRSLPDDIAQLPHLSRQCSLQRPADVALWSDAAEERFHAIADDGAMVFTVRLVMPSSRASVVQLAYHPEDEDAVDLSAELAALCNKFSLSDDTDPLITAVMSSSTLADAEAPAADQTPGDEEAAAGHLATTQPSIVMRAASSQDFYVRLHSQREQLTAIEKRLAEEAQSWPVLQVLKASDLCAARSTADGRFYRAMVTELCTEGKFVDWNLYGFFFNRMYLGHIGILNKQLGTIRC